MDPPMDISNSQNSVELSDKSKSSAEGSTVEIKSQDNDNDQDVEFECSSQTKSMKDIVISMLDELDQRVEKLRSNAMALENEKDDVLGSLDTLSNAQIVHQLEGIDMDEVNRYAERIFKRCVAVDVDIKTERSSPQLESLHKVNNMIDGLIRDLKEDALHARKRCIAYINACSEQVSNSIPEIDSKFESAVLGCEISDQKRVKKRLTGLYSYFSSTREYTEEGDEEIIVSQTIERSLQEN